MNQRSTKLAVIFGKYIDSGRPFITKWANALVCLDYAKIYSDRFVKLKTGSIFKLSESAVKIWTLPSFIANCVRWPSKLLNWLFLINNLSLKEKIIVWGRYTLLLLDSPKVIHLLNPDFYWRYAKIIKALKSKSIVTFHGGDILIRPTLNAEWRKNLKELFIQCDHLHFLSNYLRKKGIDLGAPQGKTFVIYPGIDVQFYQPDLNIETKSENELIMTTVGRLAWEKGIPYVLRSVKSLKIKGFNIRYWIVGDGSEKNQLLFWIKELGLEENVKLFGYQSVSSIKLILARSDVYIHPAISEAVGVAIIEASAMELPVIASNVGGIPEIVDNNITGILIPANNEQKIEEAVISLVYNKDKRTEMGKNGRKKVLKEFSLEHMIKDWKNVYDRIV